MTLIWIKRKRFRRKIKWQRQKDEINQEWFSVQENHQRADGTYHYSWTDANRKRRYVYAKTLDELRYKEEQIEKDKKDGIKAEARYTTLNDMYELWRDLKRGLKNNTFENYKYMYETFVRNQIGSKTVSSLKKTDIKRFYNYLADERHLKPATIDNIHTVLHQILDMAVDDDYLRNNPSNNVLKELKQSHCFQTEKRRALTRPEQELFLSYLKNTPSASLWYPIFEVLVGTGLRVVKQRVSDGATLIWTKELSMLIIRWYIMTIEPTVVSVAAILISIPRKRRLANAKSRCWISSKKHSLWKKKDRSFLIFIVKLL